MNKALRFRPLINPVLAGAIAAVAFTALWYADPSRIAGFIRERAIDAVQLIFPRQALGARVLVVDIDAKTLAGRGSWPLPRGDLARLVSIITTSHASVIAFDIFFPSADRHSARTLAGEIAVLSGDDKITRLLAGVPDTDAAFAKSLTAGPSVLGALAANGGKPFSVNLIRSDGVLDEQTAGVANGVIEPYQPLADATLGLGVLSLFGDEDGRIRRVPLIVSAAGTLAPGLMLEAARIAAGANLLSVDGRRAVASFGSRVVPLQEAGTLRIRWSDPARWPARTMSAIDILDGTADLERFAGAAVVIGTSTPEAGALRPTPVSPLTPTVQIQAEALQQILDDQVLRRPALVPRLELGVMLVLGVAAAFIARTRGPIFVGVGLASLVLTWLAVAVVIFLRARIVIDPVGPVLAILVAGNVAGAASFSQTRQLKALINRRFEQYLAPDVVREIVAQPDRLKRAGEIREMTALFTDIEDFTPMANRLKPQELIALLDVYFDNLCRLVTEHGGMVDGIVGDAIHAFFNIPLERSAHADAALDCGLAIIRFSERFRREPRAAGAGFGRTRIGIETGPAIVGDVGGPQRLNYTAYGDAVIVAARLEAANKLFDTMICVGPGCAGAVRNRQLVPLGPIQLKGMQSATEVFTVEAPLLNAPTTSPHPRAPEPISLPGPADHPAS
jgi:adenylate cyclase